MPYMEIRLSKAFTEAQLESAKVALGRDMSLLKDKDESTLMLDFVHSPHMFLRGIPLQNGGFIDCRLFGPQMVAAKRAFSEAVFKSFTEIFGTDPKDVYINYTHYKDWGVGGSLKV